MRKFKKIASAVAAFAMVAAMAVPTFAVYAEDEHTETDTTITIAATGSEEDVHTYAVYKIFSGKATDSNLGTATTGASGGKELQDITWAADSSSSTAWATNFVKALKGETVSGVTTISTTLSAKFADCDSAKPVTVATVLTGLTSDEVKEFAKWLGNNIAALGLPEVEDAYDSDEDEITVSEDGYYIVIETSLDDVDAVTAHLLGVVRADGNDLELTAKSAMPTVAKKVKEDDKTTWTADSTTPAWPTDYNDVADYTIGEAVPFYLRATLPSNIADYKDYWMKFTDNLGKGFKLPTSFEVKIGSTTVNFALSGTGSTTAQNTYTTNDTNSAGITVKVTPKNENGNAYKANGEVEDDLDGDKYGYLIEIEITDVQQISGVTASTLVEVYYSAVLDKDAVIGKPGNYNDVYLEYDNNPNVDGVGDIETDEDDDNGGKKKRKQKKSTKKDGVVVFTYSVDVHKYDGTDTTKQSYLAGAVFALYKLDSDGTTPLYMAYDGDEVVWVKASITEAGVMTVADDDAVYGTGKEKADKAASIKFEKYTTNAEGAIKFSGLDDKTDYYLTELVAPTGYNKLTDPIKVEIVAKTVNGHTHDAIGEDTVRSGDAQLTDQNGKAYTFTYGDEEEEPEVFVENNSGVTLPSTGGIGTTLFYLIGGTLVVGAGVTLITKKRMQQD